MKVTDTEPEQKGADTGRNISEGVSLSVSCTPAPYGAFFVSAAFCFPKVRKKENYMETRIALIGIILESRESVDALNHLLSEYGEYVIGRMGIPYREKGIHVISVAVDAPNNIISALSGKLGMLPGVSTKTIYGKNI